MTRKEHLLNRQLGAMDIARELLINRYMLSSILTSLYRINASNNYNFGIIKSLLDGGAKEKNKEKKESPPTPKERKENKKEKKRLLEIDIIQFEKFSITHTQYEALVREYGVEIVTEACVLLDGYLKEKNRNLKDSYKKLKEWAIHLVLKDRMSSLRTDIMVASTNLDYTKINDKVQALKYINSVPEHRRNIDNGVKYLIEKFKLSDGD
jgi:hypothetical protein